MPMSIERSGKARVKYCHDKAADTADSTARITQKAGFFVIERIVTLWGLGAGGGRLEAGGLLELALEGAMETVQQSSDCPCRVGKSLLLLC